MTHHQLPKGQLQILANVFVLGIDFGVPEDSHAVLKVLRHAKPDMPGLAASEARFRIHEGDMHGARALLETADAAHSGTPIIKAMLALCLYLQRDGLWQAYAEETRALGDKNATSIVDSLDAISRGVREKALPDSAVDVPEEATPMTGMLC